MRHDVRPRPPQEQVASNSLLPHLLLNAAHPRECGQVTVNLFIFCYGSATMLFSSSSFPFSSVNCTRTTLTQFVGTSSLIRCDSPPTPPGPQTSSGLFFHLRCVCRAFIYFLYQGVWLCACVAFQAVVCVFFATALTYAIAMEDQ